MERLTIDEAIELYKMKARAAKNFNIRPTVSYTAEECEQHAEWLEELKKRRSEDYGYMADIHQSIGYRQALDDFVETLVSAFDETNIKEYGFYPENLVRQVAEQLKECD